MRNCKLGRDAGALLVNINIAKIYTTDEHGNKVPVPVNMALRTGAGVIIQPYQGEFLITWIDSYVLAVDGGDILWLQNQKQQAFAAGGGVTAFTIP